MKQITFTILFTVNLMNSEQLFKLNKGVVVNPEGEKVFLKGCNIGNWLMLEMWMLSYADRGIADQHEFINTFKRRFGDTKSNELMETYRQSWITEKDFDIIKSFDMNTIRLPFDYKILMDSDEKPFKLKKKAWYWLDQAIEWAKKRDMYIILDMHGAPGRQSAMDHSGRSGHNKLWSEKSYQDQTIWLWGKISEKYINESTIVAYDLLNEPWGDSDKNLKKLTIKIHKRILKNNDKHIIIYPGHHSGIGFYKDIRSVDMSNVIYTMHFYPGFFGWGSANVAVHSEFLQSGLNDWVEIMEDFNSPLLVGEFNVVIKKAGGGEMMRRYFDFYKKLNWPATMWSYKVLNENGGVGDGSWGMTTNSEKLSFIDIKTASFSEIENWIQSYASMEYSIDEDLRYWLTTNQSPSKLAPLPPRPPSITQSPYNDRLPKPWKVRDIGRPIKDGGQKVYENGNLVLYAGGNDIWNEKDQFRFVYQKVDEDFNIEIKVDSLRNTHTYAKAGLMIRKSLNSKSAHGLINIFPTGITEFGYRTKDGETMKALRGPELDWENVRLKIIKSRNKAEFFVYSDMLWVKCGETQVLDWGDSFYVGIATLSHDNSQLTKANYSDLSFSIIK